LLNVKPGGIYSDYWALKRKSDVSLRNTQHPTIGAYPQPKKFSLPRVQVSPILFSPAFNQLIQTFPPTVAASDEVSVDAAL